jgi:hypothetical protein
MGNRNRRVEYSRGRGAYYVKFIVRGDRTIAYQALWELVGLWRDVRRGVVRPWGSPASRAWHLAIGATIMTARMLTSFAGYRGHSPLTARREMGMTYWLGKAEAETTELGR